MPIYWRQIGKNKYDQPAGELRNRVAFLRRVITVVDGNTHEDWEEAFQCWCKVDSVAGVEQNAAAAEKRQEDVLFTIRYRKGVARDMLILHEGVRYDIMSINDPDTRHIKLQIRAGSVYGDAR